MATFIDDQGGTGWTPGSHTHFRLAAAWLPTDQVNTFKDAIGALRRKLALRANYEFKFVRTHDRPQQRREFFGIAMDLGLRFTACAFDKRRIRPGSVAPSLFHHGCAIILATYLHETYRAAEDARHTAHGRALHEPLIVDDNKDKGMLQCISNAFCGLRSKRFPNVPLTQKARFRNSEIDEAVQLADMVMGAIGAHLDGDDTWYRVIRTRGVDLGVVEVRGCGALQCLDDLSQTVEYKKSGPDDHHRPGRESHGTQSTA